MDRVRVSRVCATSITVLSAVGVLSATAGADAGQGGVVSYDPATNRLQFVGTDERNHLRLTKAGGPGQGR